MRILTEIPEEDLQKLDALALRRKSSRAAAIRDAVRLYLAQQADARSWIARGAGYWKDRAELADGVEYQREVRQDRSRPEEV